MTKLEYQKYLKTDHWRKKRSTAIKRAAGKCQLCAATSSLEVHHNTYERLGAERATDLIVLCNACHTRHSADISITDDPYAFWPPVLMPDGTIRKGKDARIIQA